MQSETLATPDFVKDKISSICLGVHGDTYVSVGFLNFLATRENISFFDGCKENILCYPHKAMNTPFELWES